MNKVILTAICLLCSLSAVIAQKTFQGKVVDKTGDAIPGVSIVLKSNKSIGTATNINGIWTLPSVPNKNSVLIFSSIGMKSIELPAGRAKIVMMETDTEQLDEVVVVAYGRSKKSDLTGSIAIVNSDEIEKRTAISVGSAIDGLALGVEVATVSGEPGANPTIRVRGTGSINSSNEPLYVIDGVAQYSDNLSVIEGDANLGALSALNPNDIESVSVLKDAAAAALYGSRAGNGVVLITTKRGSVGKTNYAVKMETGITDFAVKPLELATPKEAYDYKLMAFKNYFIDREGQLEGQAEQSALRAMGKYFPLYDPNRSDSDYDWIGHLFREGKTSSIEFSATGGNQKTKFYASLGYIKMDGVAVGSDFNRISGRINIDHKSSDLFEFGGTSYISRMRQNAIPTEGIADINPFYATRTYLNQLTPIKTKEGIFTPIHQGASMPNLVEEMGLIYARNDIWTFTQQGYLKLNFTENFYFKSTNSMNFTLSYGTLYQSPDSHDGASYDGSVGEDNKRNLKLSTSNTLNYKNCIDDVHNLDFMVGWEIEKTDFKILGANGKNLPNGNSNTLDVAAKPTRAFLNRRGDRMQSFLSRFNYNYQQRYYLSLSFRADASSRLGIDNIWGNFWSLSGAWRISSEDWFSDINFINNLKVKASYGTSGNLPTYWVGARGLYSYGNDYNNISGILYDQVENRELGWEKNNALNIGLEGRVFKRLGFEFEYFNRKTKDLLLLVPNNPSTGFTLYWDNIGEISNTGIELVLKSDNIKNEDISWNTELQLSKYKNTVDKLVEGKDIRDYQYILREGQSMSSFYLRDWAGVNPMNGHGQWYVLEDEQRVDKDGDGHYDVTENINSAGRRIVGNAIPDFTGSFNNVFRYRNFDLSVLFSFKCGGDAYIDSHAVVFNDGAMLDEVVTKAQLNGYWKNKGDIAIHPKVSYSPLARINSSRNIVDASFLRLKSINFGYSLPTELIERVGLSKVRFYASALNLLTFSKVKDFDPETTSRGTMFSNFNLPPVKTITFGAQINF